MFYLHQNFTFFLSFQNCVKKVTASLQNLGDLHGIVYEKFGNYLTDSTIELYANDEEFHIECELENIWQLYHGAIVHVRSKPNSYTTSSTNSQQLSSNSNSNRNTNISPCSFEDCLKRISPSPYIDDNSQSHQTAINKQNFSLDSIMKYQKDEANKCPNQGIVDREDEINYKNYQIPSKGFYVRLSNIAITTTSAEIVTFFNPLKIVPNGVFFPLNSKQNRFDSAFVVFDTYQHYENALEKHGMLLNNREIEIYKTNKYKFKNAIKISRGMKVARFSHAVMIKLKGFSFEIDEYDIHQWLQKENLNPYKIYIIYDNKNRNSGEAYVEYHGQDKHISAQTTFRLNNYYLGKRYINIYPSSVNEFRMVLAESMGAILPANVNPYFNCVKIQNLPKTVTQKCIKKFFNEFLQIYPKTVYIKSNKKTAYVQFTEKFESQLALTRNGQSIGKNIIYLTQISKYQFLSVARGGNNDDSDDNDTNMYLQEYANYHNHTTPDVQFGDNKENIPRLLSKEIVDCG